MKPVSLVLLPGLDGTGELFKPLIDCLPGWISPIVASYPKARPCGYRELKAYVQHLLPQDSDFVILGESFSGPLAVMAAHEKPNGLRGVILCATFIKNPFPMVPAWLKIFSIGPIYRLWPLAIRARTFLEREQYGGLAEMALKAIQSVEPQVIAKRVREILAVNVEEEFRNCRIPFLYLVASKDHLIRENNLRGLLTINPCVSVARVDTLHFLLQLEPRRAAAEIETFILRLFGSGE